MKVKKNVLVVAPMRWILSTPINVHFGVGSVNKFLVNISQPTQPGGKLPLFLKQSIRNAKNN